MPLPDRCPMGAVFSSGTQDMSNVILGKWFCRYSPPTIPRCHIRFGLLSLKGGSLQSYQIVTLCFMAAHFK